MKEKVLPNDETNRVKLGFLYPGFAAEDDYPRLAEMTGTRAELVHTSIGEDAHTVEALSDMGSLPRLLEGAKVLEQRGVDSVVWSSTSASFVLGWDGAMRQAEALEEALSVPASTTAFAFVSAAKKLGVERAAVAATYPEDIARLFEKFLEIGGVSVVRVGTRGIITAAEVGTLGREAVLELAVGNDDGSADVLLMPDTALHSAAWLEEIEDAVGKPVITANQATYREAMRLAGDDKVREGLGSLFRV
ncbi:MAG: maleate cis-trans isomerase [Rubrobacter sp.]|jgi:maleate cis-trans isomerase|nr:maleate cis-trans isomerase [Rubrobacter sp.]